jgi:hypothetical protein
VKLSDFLRVEALVVRRSHLVSLKDEGRIEITIAGHHQNRAFVDSVDAAIRLELRHQIVELDEKLMDLGVRIDCNDVS